MSNVYVFSHDSSVNDHGTHMVDRLVTESVEPRSGEHSHRNRSPIPAS